MVFEAIGENDVAAFGELVEVVFDLEAIIGFFFEGWFVDDNVGAFATKPFNNILDSGRAEVVGAAFHGEPIDADSFWLAFVDVFGDKFLASFVCIDDGAD